MLSIQFENSGQVVSKNTLGINRKLKTLFQGFLQLTSLVIGLILIVSTYFHLLNSISNYEAILKFQILPNFLAWFATIAIPSVQLVIGVWLVFGFHVRFAATTTSLLMGAFFIAQVSALARDLKISCHCFGEGGSLVSPYTCLLYTSPSPRDRQKSRMPSSA